MGSMSEEIWNEGRAEGEAKGRAEGRAEGEAKGRFEERLLMVLRLLKKGLLPPDEIAECSGMSLDEVRQLAAAQAG